MSIKANHILLILFTVYFSATAYSQQGPSNFYFDSPQPSVNHNAHLAGFDGVYFAENDTNKRIEIVADTVFAHKIIWSHITQGQMKETPKLMARNGFLHGLKRNDSIPYVQSNDTLYFGVPYKTVVFYACDSMVCRKLDDNRVVLNFEERTGKWTCTILEKDQDGLLYMKHMDHEEVAHMLNLLGIVEPDKAEHLPTQFATAEPESFMRFVNQGGFTGNMVFYKPNEKQEGKK